ncbi:hypothetical protein [Lentzea sp. E54]|uniref:hypothetical protein n=1 Tax=Lentzea xerophila TaxID=3435883 RepID=UPI003DA3CA65
MIARQRRDVAVLAEPAQREHRMPEAGQRPGAGAAVAAFGAQQAPEALGQFAGTSSVAL